MTVDVIASAWVVTAGTVRTQITAILSKLEVSAQLAAVGVARHATWRPRDLPITG